MRMSIYGPTIQCMMACGKLATMVCVDVCTAICMFIDVCMDTCDASVLSACCIHTALTPELPVACCTLAGCIKDSCSPNESEAATAPNPNNSCRWPKVVILWLRGFGAENKKGNSGPRGTQRRFWPAADSQRRRTANDGGQPMPNDFEGAGLCWVVWLWTVGEAFVKVVFVSALCNLF